MKQGQGLARAGLVRVLVEVDGHTIMPDREAIIEHLIHFAMLTLFIRSWDDRGLSYDFKAYKK